MTKKVALIRGDGTGPELVEAMLQVVEKTGAGVEFITCAAGYEWWAKNGSGDSLISDEGWKTIYEADACFKAPCTSPSAPGTPKSVEVSLRQGLDLYANVRPIRTFKDRAGPLGEVNFVCVRETTEGLYSGMECRLPGEVALTIRKITGTASKRIVRFAFETAKKRGLEKVVAITKVTAMKESDGLFLDSLREIARDYPEVDVEEYLIDNMAYQLVKNPQRFNRSALLSTNLFMDIISEEASALVGSIGVAYSANFGERYAMFEPAHGSSPKYRGLNKVNPTATILSAGWMLEHLGEVREGNEIFRATESVISEGKAVTYDIGGDATTSAMANAIANEIS